MMDTWNYRSKIKAQCGVDSCKKRFWYRGEWVQHCKQKHPDYYEAELKTFLVPKPTEEKK